MSSHILTNPEAALASARRLVVEQQTLPATLADPVTHTLGKWLADRPDCLGAAGQPDPSWCDAARLARREGRRCVTFRRRKRATEEARTSLKWITLAAGYAGEVRGKAAHKDPVVQTEARKLVRGLMARRMTWDQATDALKEIRSLVQKRGKHAAAKTPVRAAAVIGASDGLRWREVVTVAELSSIGRTNGLCTHEQSYTNRLKNGDLRFFTLETLDAAEFVGLVSIDTDGDIAGSLRGPGNCSLLPYREAVIDLLEALGVDPGGSTDLLDLGIVEELPGIDLLAPDLIVGATSIWYGRASADHDEDADGECEGQTGAMLIRVEGSFVLLKEARTGYFLRQGGNSEFDSDDLLGRLLTTLNPVSGAPARGI